MSSGRSPTSFDTINRASDAIICFASGTLIRTPQGERRIESLLQGEDVLTVDRGPQPIRWIGRRTVRASGALAPIRFARGTIGNDRDLLVSPQHRMLVPRRPGLGEVLAPALALIDEYRVTVAYGGMVTYHHMMFDRHEVIVANGAQSESFHPDGFGLDTLDASEREDLFALFPSLRSDLGAYGPASRPCLAPEEARARLRA